MRARLARAAALSLCWAAALFGLSLCLTAAAGQVLPWWDIELAGVLLCAFAGGRAAAVRQHPPAGRLQWYTSGYLAAIDDVAGVVEPDDN